MLASFAPDAIPEHWMIESLVEQIIAWLEAHSSDGPLREQLKRASISRADYLRTGYFVYLSVPDGAVAAAEGAHLPTVGIRSPLLMDGGGATLFLRDGYLHYLEIYARGGFFPEQIDDFELGPEL